MIKAITFDCWDTLIVDDKGRDSKMLAYLEVICQDNGICLADKDLLAGFAREDKLREKYVIDQRKTKNALQRTETLLEILDIHLPFSEVERIAYYFDRVALDVLPPRVPGVDVALKTLAPKYRLGVICNSGYHSGDTVRGILDGHNLLDYFVWLSFSDELDVAKPDPHIFEHTVNQLSCERDEALHIGDSEYSDIAGAKNTGMKAILFTGINKKYKDHTKADCVIDSYSELLAVLEKLE